MANADWDIPSGFRNSSRSISPGCVGGTAVGSRRSTRRAGAVVERDERADECLVVVRDFNFVGISLLPAEANTILLIDTNAMSAAPRSCQTLKPVHWRDSQFQQVENTIQLRHLTAEDRPDPDWAGGACTATIDAVEQILRCEIRKATYHATYYNGRRSRGATSLTRALLDLSSHTGDG